MTKEFEGKVLKFTEIESGISKAGKEWQKQGIVLATENEYNPEVCITAFGKEKMHSMNKLEVGMVASIMCNVSSKLAKNGRYYHNIDGYFFTNQSNKSSDKITNGEAEEDMPF